MSKPTLTTRSIGQAEWDAILHELGVLGGELPKLGQPAKGWLTIAERLATRLFDPNANQLCSGIPVNLHPKGSAAVQDAARSLITESFDASNQMHITRASRHVDTLIAELTGPRGPAGSSEEWTLRHAVEWLQSRTSYWGECWLCGFGILIRDALYNLQSTIRFLPAYVRPAQALKPYRVGDIVAFRVRIARKRWPAVLASLDSDSIQWPELGESPLQLQCPRGTPYASWSVRLGDSNPSWFGGRHLSLVARRTSGGADELLERRESKSLVDLFNAGSRHGRLNRLRVEAGYEASECDPFDSAAELRLEAPVPLRLQTERYSETRDKVVLPVRCGTGIRLSDLRIRLSPGSSDRPDTRRPVRHLKLARQFGGKRNGRELTTEFPNDDHRRYFVELIHQREGVIDGQNMAFRRPLTANLHHVALAALDASRHWDARVHGEDRGGFELGVHSLLSSLGFNTVWLGEQLPGTRALREPVDILAFDGNELVIAVEATTDAPSAEKVLKLAGRRQKLESAVRGAMPFPRPPVAALMVVAMAEDLIPAGVSEAVRAQGGTMKLVTLEQLADLLAAVKRGEPQSEGRQALVSGLSPPLDAPTFGDL